MDGAEIHELSAAYALDALGPTELEAYEQHLARCPECQEAVAHFQAVAAELAHDAYAPPPPAELRERLLARAAAEPPKVVGLRRRRWPVAVAATVAVAASAAAVALGLWAADLSNQLDERKAEVLRANQIAAILANEDSRLIPLQGADGVLVVNTATREGSLVITGLEAAPAGKTYEAWVIEGKQATKAGLFAGGAARTAVSLAIPVPEGAVVAVTREKAGGVDQPTQTPFITAQAS
jgi:anti-sigma factor RsiW